MAKGCEVGAAQDVAIKDIDKRLAKIEERTDKNEECIESINTTLNDFKWKFRLILGVLAFIVIMVLPEGGSAILKFIVSLFG
jgi:hypothetical protein